MSQKELEDKIIRYRELEEKVRQLNERGELFTLRVLEIEQTMQTIKEIETSKESDILLPLGSNVFIPGKIEEKDKMLIGIGSDLVVEKNVDDVKKELDDRKKILEEGVLKVQDNMLKVAEEMGKLEPEIEAAFNKLQKG